jgi:hypothetical protein
MTLPEFIRGYRQGVKADEKPLTDRELLDALKTLAEEQSFENVDNPTLQFAVGSLVGCLFGRML